MGEINSIKYKRAVVPEDAINLNTSTIDTGDASKSVACAAIYARFKRKDGTYSFQLVFSRSKLVPEEMNLPRAELLAATLNVHTGEVVKRSFQQLHKKHYKFTDSQITLYWIHSDQKPFKQWVKNRVIEIRRFTQPQDWKFVQSENMIADIGTRKGAKIKDVDQNSIWINGLDWMKSDESQFPAKSVEEVKLDNNEKSDLRKEMILSSDIIQFPHSDLDNGVVERKTEVFNSKLIAKRNVPTEVLERYKFSDYLLDPNFTRFNTVIRIVAYVIRFIRNLKEKMRSKVIQNKSILLSNEKIEESKNYFFRKATLEVQEFVKESRYRKIAKERVHYVGRMLPSKNVNSVGTLSNVIKDLSTATFCVPIIDKHSPLAYSIVNEVHWYSNVVKHSGIETVYRYVLKFSYILDGRDLIKLFRKQCERCRFMNKKSIDVAMGPISNANITIAPAFYVTQVDLAGPFPSYSTHHKRKTVKIWMAVFCCATTSAVKIKLMDDYSAKSFIQSFVRFACEVGYPKFLLPDEGSQIVSSCSSMKLNFTDIKNALHLKMNVQFKTCPVGGHNFHGKVERKIKEIKASIEKNAHNERLSILQWETLSSIISNTINDLPLALENFVSDFEQMDLITPNRLLLGRNNDRSPTGGFDLVSKPKKLLRENQKVFEVWFEGWLISHVPKLMHQPKWFNSDHCIKVGDILSIRNGDVSYSR
ncbi:uncharacterized protein LOC130648085 [Hydractinia symbiolongicarpus]|uniref:uncharacterized protein LOC130648085 n=1 Tax=Hydractinia symbiolongicarpus TaxID=13093 RepID=UPI00255024F0|nr:uncharacterized protein LOC130648085 [Hydractinia symbiolongicarpus]